MERQPDEVLEQRFADLFREVCALQKQRNGLLAALRSALAELSRLQREEIVLPVAIWDIAMRLQEVSERFKGLE